VLTFWTWAFLCSTSGSVGLHWHTFKLHPQTHIWSVRRNSRSNLVKYSGTAVFCHPILEKKEIVIVHFPKMTSRDSHYINGQKNINTAMVESAKAEESPFLFPSPSFHTTIKFSSSSLPRDPDFKLDDVVYFLQL